MSCWQVGRLAPPFDDNALFAINDLRATPIQIDDALRDELGLHADVVITNPPFGKRSSITVVNEEGETDRETLTYNRPDFWTTTSNKQLNFVQHIKSLLAIHGRVAIVVPDNVSRVAYFCEVRGPMPLRGYLPGLGSWKPGAGVREEAR